jgi:hypothetical protein
MSSWYAPLVRELGIANATQDDRWKRGCFFIPPNGTCADALNVPDTAAGVGVGSGEGSKCVADEQHVPTHHVMHSCARLAEYYTPKLAAVVTATFRKDLERFGYPKWNGDISRKWH